MARPKTTGRFDTREALECEVVKIADTGASLNEIATQCGVSAAVARRILEDLAPESQQIAAMPKRKAKPKAKAKRRSKAKATPKATNGNGHAPLQYFADMMLDAVEAKLQEARSAEIGSEKYQVALRHVLAGCSGAMELGRR